MERMNGYTGKLAKRNVVQEKSFAFALRIVTVSRRLQFAHRELVLSKQLLCSDTSIGANIEEAIAAQSKKDFLAKMSIALKEARETHYWLRLIQQSHVTVDPDVDELLQACQELVALLSRITLTTRHNLGSNKRASSPNAKNSSVPISHSASLAEHSSSPISHSTFRIPHSNHRGGSS
jgi:four helix bundle protein